MLSVRTLALGGAVMLAGSISLALVSRFDAPPEEVPGEASPEETSGAVDEVLAEEPIVGVLVAERSVDLVAPMEGVVEIIHVGMGESVKVGGSVMVLDTKEHRPTIEPAGLVIDLDMAPLSIGWDEFRVNTEKIYREYAAHPREKIDAGRRQFFLELLAREKIFFTDWGATRESVARTNMPGFNCRPGLDTSTSMRAWRVASRNTGAMRSMTPAKSRPG